MKVEKMVNLTPHNIVIMREDGKEKMTIPPSGRIVRIKADQKIIGEVNGIPIVKTTFRDIEGLPEPEPNTVFIVSSLVAQAIKSREDIVAPDTTPQGVVRNEKGQIIGVKRFQRW